MHKQHCFSHRHHLHTASSETVPPPWHSPTVMPPKTPSANGLSDALSRPSWSTARTGGASSPCSSSQGQDRKLVLGSTYTGWALQLCQQQGNPPSLRHLKLHLSTAASVPTLRPLGANSAGLAALKSHLPLFNPFLVTGRADNSPLLILPLLSHLVVCPTPAPGHWGRGCGFFLGYIRPSASVGNSFSSWASTGSVLWCLFCLL